LNYIIGNTKSNMKIKSLFIVLFSVLLMGYIPSGRDISVNIKNALKSGDANALSAYFDQNLELVIDSENVDYSKINTTHAKLILKSFFKKKPPIDFKYEYQGATASIQYCTGNYKCANEQYWVYIIIKNRKTGLTIDSIHFKKDAKI
jgi:hypothetical protein